MDADALPTDFAGEAGRVGRWSGEPNQLYPAHSHSYRKVICCLEGSIEFHLERGAVMMRQGDRLVIEAGLLHWASAGPAGVSCAERQEL